MSSLQALLDKQEGRSSGSTSSRGYRGPGRPGASSSSSFGSYGDESRWRSSGRNNGGSSDQHERSYGRRTANGTSPRDSWSSNRSGSGRSINSRWANEPPPRRQQQSRSSRPQNGEGHEFSLSYEERRAKIEREAIEASRRAKTAECDASNSKDNGSNDEQDDVASIETWVGPLIEGRCTYYQDRDKVYPFHTGERGSELLQTLMDTNRALLQLNQERIEEEAQATEEAVTELNGISADVVIRIGQGLYAEKPTLRTKGVTWSTEEYSHAGLQRMYLRMKSIQRFTEIWALLERSSAIGVFNEVYERGTGTVRIAAIGGGPGYELLATKLFFSRRVPDVELELICMDVCPAWRPFAELLGFRFVYYDINEEGTNPLEVAGLERGELHFCIVSCVMIYVTNDKTLDMFHKLVHEDGVSALLLSERGEKTRACTMMEERGGSVIRLIDQSFGVDERQAVLCSNEFRNAHLSKPNDEDIELTFPNVPYTEHKLDRHRFSSSRYR